MATSNTYKYVRTGSGDPYSTGVEMINQPTLADGQTEISYDEYINALKAWKPKYWYGGEQGQIDQPSGGFRVNPNYNIGESAYDFYSRTNPSQIQNMTGQAGAYVTLSPEEMKAAGAMPGDSNMWSAKSYNDALALQQQAAAGTMINIAPAGSPPQYVQKGSPGASGLSMTDYLKTPEAAAFLKANPTINPVLAGTPQVGTDSAGYATPSKKYFKFADNDKVFDSSTGKWITADEAAKIPDFWNQVETLTAGTPAKVGGQVLTPEDLLTRESTKLPGLTGGNESIDASVASVNAYSQNIANTIAQLTPPQTAAEKKQQEILDKLTGLAEQEAGKGADQLAAEEKAGIPDLNKQIQDVSNQITTLNAEYNAYVMAEQGKPVTMATITGNIAAKKASIGSQMLLLQAQAQTLQGSLANAQNTVNRAIDLKYSTIEATQNIYQAQLNALQPTLNKEEKILAMAQQQMIDDRNQALAEAKTAEKNQANYALSNMNDYKDAGIQITDDYETVNQKVLNSGTYQASIAPKVTTSGGSIGGSGGGSTTPTTKSIFTQTQTNKGAATAGISLEDFARLDENTQNFFVNNSSEIEDFKKNVDIAKEDDEDPTEIEKQVSESQLPDAVKDTMIRYLWSKFERPTENKPGFFKSVGNTVSSWWDKIF